MNKIKPFIKLCYGKLMYEMTLKNNELMWNNSEIIWENMSQFIDMTGFSELIAFCVSVSIGHIWTNINVMFQIVI